MRRILAMLGGVAAMLAVLAGCGSPSSTNQPSAFGTPYLVVDMVDGSTVATVDPSVGGTGTTVRFVRITLNGQTCYLADRPMTRSQWGAAVGTTPWTVVASGLAGAAGDDPAAHVSWTDVQDLAQAVARKANLPADLPTAAELDELAGRLPASAVVVSAESTTTTGPLAVGTRAAQLTAPKVWDVLGNIRAWTADGVLVGGSWADLRLTIGAGRRYPGVLASARHPLAGARLIIRAQ